MKREVSFCDMPECMNPLPGGPCALCGKDVCDEHSEQLMFVLVANRHGSIVTGYATVPEALRICADCRTVATTGHTSEIYTDALAQLAVSLHAFHVERQFAAVAKKP